MPDGKRNNLISDRNADFEDISYVEPYNTGCPVGPDGAIGWSSTEEYDPSMQVIRYLWALEEDAVSIVKRLRELVDSADPNTRENDDDIDTQIRYHFYNLFAKIRYIKNEMGGDTVKQYRCYICLYHQWSDTLPDDFVDEHTHKACAEHLQSFNEYTRLWKEKIEREASQTSRWMHEF